MIVNEDYFKDIDITDGDVDVSTENSIYDEEQHQDVKKMLDDLEQRYDGMIQISTLSNKNFFNTTHKFLDKCVKRIEYLCKLYDVEHSDVFIIDVNALMTLNDEEPQVVVRYGSKYITKINKSNPDVKNVFNTISKYYVNIVVYVNFRKFKSYKDAYWFTHNLYKTIYKVNFPYGRFISGRETPVFDEIQFCGKPMTFEKGRHGECYLMLRGNPPVFFLEYWDIDEVYRYDYLNNNDYPGIYNFFSKALRFLFPDYHDNVEIMMLERDIKNGLRPFSK